MKRAVLLLAIGPLLSSCTAAGFCCGRLTDFDETTDADRRKVERERKEEIEEKREKGAEKFEDRADARRERDYESYLKWVIEELELPVRYAREPSRYYGGQRVIGAYGFAGRDGLLVEAKVVEVPAWHALVSDGVKERFASELSPRLVTRIAKELEYAEPYLLRWFDNPLPGLTITFQAYRVDVFEQQLVRHVLGTTLTDVAGIARLSLEPSKVPPRLDDGVYELAFSVLGSETGIKKQEQWTSGALVVRRAPQKAVLITAPSVLDFARLRAALEDRHFNARDVCVPDSLRSLAKTHRVVIVSYEPRSMSGVIGKGAGSVALDATLPMVVAPDEILASTTDRAAFLDRVLAMHKGFWSEVTLLGVDPALESEAAKKAGVPYHAVAKLPDGGWCAGAGTLVPPSR